MTTLNKILIATSVLLFLLVCAMAVADKNSSQPKLSKEFNINICGNAKSKNVVLVNEIPNFYAIYDVKCADETAFQIIVFNN